MATVKLVPPSGGRVAVEVNSDRVDKLIEAGWRKPAEPKSAKKSTESKSSK